MTVIDKDIGFIAKDLFAVSGIILASIAFVMELTLLPLVLSDIQFDLNLDIHQLSWVFNTYAVAVAVAVLLTGVLGDRINKRGLFFCGVLLFIFGSILSAISESFWYMVLARAVQGVGGGLFSPLVPIFLARAFHENPGKILIIWGGLAGVVATTMPLFGGALVSLFGWRAIFVFFAGVALMSILLSIVFSQIRSVERTVYSLSYRKILEMKNVWFLMLYIFFTYGCVSYFLFFFPVMLSNLGSTPQYIAILLAVMWFSFSLTSFLLRDQIDKPILKQVLFVAPVLFALGYLVGVTFPDSTIAVLFAAFLMGIGFACCNAPSTHLLLKLAPKELHAFSASLDIVFARLGGVAAVAFFSGVTPFTAGICATVMAGLAVWSCRMCFVSTKRANVS